MDVIVLDNKYIDELLRSSSESEEIYKLVREVILQDNYSYVDFVYNVYLTYESVYVTTNKEESHLSHIDTQELINKISKYKENVIADNIVVVDIYDMLYNLNLPYTLDFCEGYSKYWLHEDIFNRLTNICNKEDVYDEFEYVIETLSGVFAALDAKIINTVYSRNEDFDRNIVIYLEIISDYLFLNIII